MHRWRFSLPSAATIGLSTLRVCAVLCTFLVGASGQLHAYTPIYTVKKTITPNDVFPGVTGSGPMTVTGLSSSGGITGYISYVTKSQGLTTQHVQGFYWNDAAAQFANLNSQTFGSSSNMPACINDSGMVAGIYWTAGLQPQQLGFVWRPDGTVASFQSPNGDDIDAVVAINSTGQVIGTYFGSGGFKRAFLWNGTDSIDLGDLGSAEGSGDSGDQNDSGQAFVWPQSINDAGIVVGTVYSPDPTPFSHLMLSTAFQWQDQTMTALDDTDNYSRTIAVGLNDAGEILGSYLNPSGSSTYAPGGFSWYAHAATDLGDLGGGSTVPFFMNDAGSITGTSYAADGTLHLFNWQQGTLRDLGSASLSATDTAFQISSVNQAGDIAGFVTDASGHCQGFLWTGGGIYNLTAIARSTAPFTVDDSNGTRFLANDAGLLACSGFNSQGVPVVLLLTNDYDGNGLPDGWETAYFGHTGVNPAAPLAWNANLTVLQAYQQGLNPVDFYNGQVPAFAILGGNAQHGAPGEFVPLPLTVSVTANGQPAVNAPVRFAVTQGGGQVQRSSNSPPGQSLTVLTDYNGQAKVFFKLSTVANGQNQITATPGSGTYTVSKLFTEYADAPAGANGSPFNPSNVVATMNRDGSADVTWTNNADPTDDEPIDIRYRDHNGQWQVLTTVDGQATSYHIPAP